MVFGAIGVQLYTVIIQDKASLGYVLAILVAYIVYSEVAFNLLKLLYTENTVNTSSMI